MDTNQHPSNRTAMLSILWCVVIPQIILVLLNFRGWTLISGEANSQEIRTALTFLGFELAVIALAIFILERLRSRKLQTGWKLSLVSLAVHSLYLWLFVVSLQNLIPDSIQPWILNEGNVGRWNATLFMPGAFLSIYALTKCFFSGVGKTTSNLTLLLTLVGTPIAWYLLVSLMQPLWSGQYATVSFIIIGTLMVIAFLATIIRVFDNIVHKQFMNDDNHRHIILASVLGLVAPLAGLALNHTLPFPSDFQSINVYALTIANGLVLLVKPSQSEKAPLMLFMRCATFPFIFYFFFVFLPFLPLSLIAIIILGAGFLMLTPLALGLFQTRITINEYKFTKANIGTRKAIAIATIGLIILPSYFVLQAVLDKRALQSSLNYFYAHDNSAQALTESETQRSASALVKLRDRKSDIQLPYLSGIYNYVVFGDLVLSDKKIKRMHHLLTNTDFPKENTSLFGSGYERRSQWRGRGFLAPNQEVKTSDINLSSSRKGSATVKLTLKNLTDETHSLFVEKLTLPEGIFVSGLRLKIEGNWESAKIFDRKTALWVFQKITEVRRDPALLYYLTPNSAEIRVYPFPSKGVREVEIDFEYHPGIASHVQFGNQDIDLNPSTTQHALLATSGAALIQSPADFGFKREPYIHYILDYSKNSNITENSFLNRIADISNKLKVDDLKISAANIGVSKLTTTTLLSTTNAVDLKKAIEEISLAKVGGLWVQQAISKEILNTSNSTNSANFDRRPIFVVLTDQDSLTIEKADLTAWSHLIPDMHAWFSYAGGELTEHQINGADKDSLVIALESQAGISILPATKSSIVDVTEQSTIKLFSPTKGEFTVAENDLNISLDVESWARRAPTWLQWREANLNRTVFENERTKFLILSREKEILLPSTSLIVVESASQWEILKRKEQQSLSNHSGLDFEDEQKTPEPSWWIMLIGLLVFLYIKERKNLGWRLKKTQNDKA